MLFSENEQKLRNVISVVLEKRNIKSYISNCYKIDRTAYNFYGVVRIGGQYYTAQHKDKSELIKQLIKELE